MQNHQMFKQFRAKFVKEAVLRSLAFGLCVGASVEAVMSLVCWLCGYEAGLYIALGVGAGIALACGFGAYYLKFRPTDSYIAARMDALGLEERSITMLGLEGDDSYIALRQREDAAVHLSAVGSKAVKCQITATMLAMAIVPSVCALSMTTVSALSIAGVLPTGNEIVNPAMPVYIELNYVAGEGGMVEGDLLQVIAVGEEMPTPVEARADEGFIFVGWDDGEKDFYRFDYEVKENTTYTAVFASINEDGDGVEMDIDPNSPSDGDSAGDDASDKPLNGGSSDDDATQAGGGGEEGEGNTDDNETTDTEGGGNGEGDGGNAGGTADRYDASNQIINGETYYGDEIEYAREEIDQILASDEELTPEEKALIEKYINSL